MQRTLSGLAGIAFLSMVSPVASAQEAPQPQYQIIRLPDDPASHMPRMLILDPRTARLWVLRDHEGNLAFIPVPYVQTTPDGRMSETVAPPPPPPEGKTFRAGP